MFKNMIGSGKKVFVAVLILSVLAMPLFFSGCKKSLISPSPTPTPAVYFTDITFEVTGTGGTDHADVNYGDEKYIDCSNTGQLRWICTGVTPIGCVSADSPCSYSNTQLPWTATISTCKGHPVKIEIAELQSGTATVKISQDGVLVAQTVIDGLGSLEYSIPGP